MKRHLFGTVGSLAALLLIVGCASDPTSSLRGGVQTVTINRTFVEVTEGKTVSLEAMSFDQQGNVTDNLPTITSSDPTVASVTVDSFQTGDPLPHTFVKLDALYDGVTFLTASVSGVTSDSTTVYVYPAVLKSAVTTSTVGQVYFATIAAEPNVTFDPDSSEVKIGDQETNIISRTDQEMSVWFVPDHSKDPDTLSVSHMKLLDTRPISSVKVGTPLAVSRGEFTGSLVTDASGGPDVYTFTATATEKFTSSTTVNVGGEETFVISQTADQLVVGLFGSNDTTDVDVWVRDLIFPDSSYAIDSLPASTKVNVRKAVLPAATADNSTNPWDVVTVTSVPGVTFDAAASEVIVNGVHGYTLSRTADQIDVAMASTVADPEATVEVTNVVANGLYDAGTLTLGSTVNLRANNAATSYSSAEDITAGPYPMTIYASIGDVFWLINPASDLDVTVTAAWTTPGVDADILWTDAGYNDYVGNFDGASSANPEMSSVTVPGGIGGWLLWLDLYDGPATIVRLDITSP